MAGVPQGEDTIIAQVEREAYWQEKATRVRLKRRRGPGKWGAKRYECFPVWHASLFPQAPLFTDAELSWHIIMLYFRVPSSCVIFYKKKTSSSLQAHVSYC